MESIEFVKESICKLVSLFPTIKCFYEYDSFDNMHTVEIKPFSYISFAI